MRWKLQMVGHLCRAPAGRRPSADVGRAAEEGGRLVTSPAVPKMAPHGETSLLSGSRVLLGFKAFDAMHRYVVPAD